MRRWLEENGRDPSVFLAKADLDWVPRNDPYLPIPLRRVVQLLVEISREAGADAPHRIVNGRGGHEIGLIGAAAFCGPTVRDGFRKLSQTMPIHCTHEVFTIAELEDGLHIRDGWAYDLGDDETLHLVQQYVASLVDMICSVAHGSIPCVDRVALVPHPEAGLSHLRPWLGEAARPAEDRALDITLLDGVAEAHFPDTVRKAALEDVAHDYGPLPKGRSLSDQVAMLVGSMLSRTTPSVDRIAVAANVSGRTLRRSLQQEGTTFSDVVERTRARIALDRLRSETGTSLKAIASDLGYANQATLSRAVKRWTGHTPRSIRAGR
jgi:AraC-like DNA-binding protein